MAHLSYLDRGNLFANGSVLINAVAISWFVIPAIQYIATVQRTDLQITGSALFPSIATLDLTPGYLILVIVSLIAAVMSSKRRHGHSGGGPAVADLGDAN